MSVMTTNPIINATRSKKLLIESIYFGHGQQPKGFTKAVATTPQMVAPAVVQMTNHARSKNQAVASTPHYHQRN
jgi:hypothetical protein